MKQIVYTIALLICLASCQRDELLRPDETNRGQGIRVYVATTNLTEVETRAAIDDVAITELDILVFDGTDEKNSKLTEHVEATILPNGEIYALLTHTKSDEPRYIAMMANTRGVITNAGTDALKIGSTLAQIRQNMNLYPKMVEAIGNEGLNIKTLPKTSELIAYTDGINYSSTLGTSGVPLKLKNRMTRISAVSNVVNMAIEAISLHQAPHSGGQLHYVAGTPLHNSETRINYYGTDIANAKFPTQNQSLYVFSTKQSADSDKEMKLVVKGRYATDAESSYYCIRFQQKTDGKFELIDFKPNCHYTVNLQKVTGRGYPTLQEAITNECSNVEIDITDDSSLGEILTNGQYMLVTSNSDCQIYGDFDPMICYPITRLITNAPSTAEIVLSSSTPDIEIATLVDKIPRDKTEIPIEVKFKKQFVSGSVTIRIGNLTRVINVSITLDPPFVKVDDVLDAKVISGYPEKTIALAKTQYDETTNPYQGDNIFESKENNAKGTPLYIHFNKITMGDTPRFGEVLLTHHGKITHTKIMTYQRPWVEMGGARWSTGNLVVGWHPDGTRRYKIGAAVEYGVHFFNESSFAIPKRRTTESYSGYAYVPPASLPDVVIGTETMNIDKLKTQKSKATPDPCHLLSSAGADTWHTTSVYEGNKITRPLLAKHSRPNGLLENSGQLFWVFNGMGHQDGSFVGSDLLDGYYAVNDGLPSIAKAGGGAEFYMNYDAFFYSWSIRCLRGNDITTLDEVSLTHTYPNKLLRLDPKYLVAGGATLSYDQNKFKVCTINQITGVVTMQANYDYTITEVQQEYATITINAGGVSKDINVRYEPIVYAQGDIVLKNGHYEIGGSKEQSTAFFPPFSKYALISPGAAAPYSYCTPAAKPSDPYTITYNITQAQKDLLIMTGDDPCHSVYDINSKKWRTIRMYNNHPIVFTPGQTDGYDQSGGFTSPLLRHSDGTYVHFVRDRGIMPGYRWSMPFGNAVSGTLILDNNVSAPPRWNRDSNSWNFRVRCERDFEREQKK